MADGLCAQAGFALHDAEIGAERCGASRAGLVARVVQPVKCTPLRANGPEFTQHWPAFVQQDLRSCETPARDCGRRSHRIHLAEHALMAT